MFVATTSASATGAPSLLSVVPVKLAKYVCAHNGAELNSKMQQRPNARCHRLFMERPPQRF